MLVGLPAARFEHRLAAFGGVDALFAGLEAGSGLDVAGAASDQDDDFPVQRVDAQATSSMLAHSPGGFTG